MKCKDCTCVDYRVIFRSHYKDGQIERSQSVPYCVRTKEPFEIPNLDHECYEYPNKRDAVELGSHNFINGIQSEDKWTDILNWYRNLYHAENDNTERGIMARAINDMFAELKEKGFFGDNNA